MARPDLDDLLHRSKLDRYLLAGERELLVQRQHWAQFAEPIGSAIGAFFVVLVLDYVMPESLRVLTNVFWWAWFVLVARAIWRWLMWRENWLVATDQRLVLNYGLITHNVAMMPLVKVTDMSYKRSPMGRLLGYGTFVMESAGQEQALRRVSWVAHPDQTYRTICAEIFGVGDQEPELALDASDQQSGSPDTPTRYTEWQQTGGEPGSQSPHLRGSTIREADTGPILYHKPTSDADESRRRRRWKRKRDQDHDD